jgi:hypothetical protein
MATLKVTITAEIPLPEGAVEQSKKTLEIHEELRSIRSSLQACGASVMAETLDFKSSAGRKKKGAEKADSPALKVA